MNIIHINQFQGKNDMERFRCAAAYLRSHRKSVLTLDPVTYELRDDAAVKLQQDIMGGRCTDNPEKEIFTYHFPYQIGIDLNGAEDVVLDGNGATLIFDGFMENISCQFCKNVTVKNLTVDLKRSAYSRGKIVKRGRLADNTPYMEAEFEDASLLSPRMPTLRMLCADSALCRICSVTFASSAAELGHGRYRFILTEDFCGDEVYLTHTYHFRPSVLIYEAVNTKIENVTIHGHCGMGILGHRSRDVSLDRVKVVPRQGYCMSTNTDATHFASCTGFLKYTDCVFEGHGDDTLNVHTYYHSLIRQEGNRYTLALQAPTGTHSSKPDYFHAGDKIELCRQDDLNPLGVYTVLSAEPDFSDHTQKVVFRETLPPVEEGVLFADISRLPRLEFLNCTVRNHLARGLLIKTRNVLVEGCRFDCHSRIGIHIAAEAYWREGVGARDVIIRNNDILHYDTGISVEAVAVRPVMPVHHNILIENNRIQSGNDTAPIIIKCAERVTVKNNLLCGKAREIPTAYSEGVTTEGNRFADAPQDLS